jgi:hypothetical protein
LDVGAAALAGGSRLRGNMQGWTRKGAFGSLPALSLLASFQPPPQHPAACCSPRRMARRRG